LFAIKQEGGSLMEMGFPHVEKNRKEEGGVKLAQYLNNAFNHLYS
jgi:hypothetical protein